MDDEFDDIECYEEVASSRRFRRGDLVVWGLEAAYLFAEAGLASVALLRNLAGMHVNWQVDQDKFATDAALEIETMTGDSDE